MELDFSATSAGEAREAGREETESLAATHGPQSPASTNRLMEEVCERENLREAWRRVKANKGSAGVDRCRQFIDAFVGVGFADVAFPREKFIEGDGDGLGHDRSPFSLLQGCGSTLLLLHPWPSPRTG